MANILWKYGILGAVTSLKSSVKEISSYQCAQRLLVVYVCELPSHFKASKSFWVLLFLTVTNNFVACTTHCIVLDFAVIWQRFAYWNISAVGALSAMVNIRTERQAKE